MPKNENENEELRLITKEDFPCLDLDSKGFKRGELAFLHRSTRLSASTLSRIRKTLKYS